MSYSIISRLAKPSVKLLQINNWKFLLDNNLNHNVRQFTSKVELPSPPKRPLTAYMIFCKENRKILLQEDPSLSSPQQIKKLAKKWSLLSIDMRKPYEVSARQSTVQYGQEHKEFYENLTDEQRDLLYKMKAEKKESRRLMRLKKALRESGVPHPANSAYALFIQSQAKGKGAIKQSSDFIKEVALMWRNLSEDDKNFYNEEAKLEKDRYEREMKEWKDKLEAEGKNMLLVAYEEIKRRKIFTSQLETVSKSLDSRISKKSSSSSKN